jgi:DNA-binding XRE family transcriptional regulator
MCVARRSLIKKRKIIGVVASERIFEDIEKKYTKAGVLLRGTRHRESLTQTEMAKKIGVAQAD